MVYLEQPMVYLEQLIFSGARTIALFQRGEMLPVPNRDGARE
jgi:hypothetical protein